MHARTQLLAQRMGSRALVTVQMMSAPATASGTVADLSMVT